MKNPAYHYVKEVLGVISIVAPEGVDMTSQNESSPDSSSDQKVYLAGCADSQVCVLSGVVLTQDERFLLSKIMGAIKQEDYCLIECDKGASSDELLSTLEKFTGYHGVVFGEAGFKFISNAVFDLAFGEILAEHDIKWLVTHSLSQMTGTQPEVISFKRETWEHLKVLASHLKSH